MLPGISRQTSENGNIHEIIRMLESPSIAKRYGAQMRLLYVLPEFPPDFGGGISTVYSKLLPILAQSGHSVTVLLASRDHLEKPRYAWRGVEVWPLQNRYLKIGKQLLDAWSHNAFLYHFLPPAWAAWHQAQDLGCFDIVEVTDWALLFIPWLVQARRQSVVVSLHGSCGQADWYGEPGRRAGEGQLLRILESAILPLADKLVTNSTLNAQFWWSQCGVRPQVIPPMAETQSRTSLMLAAPETGCSMPRSKRGTVVGRLQNWKGPEVVCKALRLLPKQNVDWIGKDAPWKGGAITTSTYLQSEYPDVLHQQLHLLGRLPVDSVQSHISEAAFHCIPSLWDVFNVTAIEAIYNDTPLICSTEAGAAMLVIDRQTGYLFDPQQPQQLAESIKSVQALSRRARQDLTTQAREHVTLITDISHITSLYNRLFRACAASFCDRDSSPWLLQFTDNCNLTNATIRLQQKSSLLRTIKLGLKIPWTRLIGNQP